MKIGFTGHRDRVTYWSEFDIIHALHPDAEWVHGGARDGFDAQVQEWAVKHGIKPTIIRPEYGKYPPKVAPIMRNHVIVDMVDMLVACWDGRKHGGTWATVDYATGKIPIRYVKIVR